MLEVLKVHTGPSLQSNATHVRGVKSVEIHSMCEILWAKVIHVFAHNFFNIQLIFNLQKVLKISDLGLSNLTIKTYALLVVLKVAQNN